MLNIIKQDICIYVPYSRPNSWTDWADIFCGHSGVAGGWHRLKKIRKFFFQNLFFHGQQWALPLVLNITSREAIRNFKGTILSKIYSLIVNNLWSDRIISNQLTDLKVVDSLILKIFTFKITRAITEGGGGVLPSIFVQGWNLAWKSFENFILTLLITI